MSVISRLTSIYSKYKLKECIKKGLKVGEGTTILCKPNFGSEPYLVSIGKNCRIASDVKFITHDGGTWVFRKNGKYKDINKYGKIDIRDNCFIGIGCIIMPNVTIGPNAVIGAGSVVTRDIPPDVCAAGNPARVICSLDEYIEKSKKATIPFPKDYKSKREVLEKYFWGENSGELRKVQ